MNQSACATENSAKPLGGRGSGRPEPHWGSSQRSIIPLWLVGRGLATPPQEPQPWSRPSASITETEKKLKLLS